VVHAFFAVKYLHIFKVNLGIVFILLVVWIEAAYVYLISHSLLIFRKKKCLKKGSIRLLRNISSNITLSQAPFISDHEATNTNDVYWVYC